MHTKKTNNTKKLMQISYHSALIKIFKITKLKKKKLFFLYWLVHPKSACTPNTWLVCLVFKLVRNVGISILVYVLVRYILASTASTGTVSTTLCAFSLVMIEVFVVLGLVVYTKGVAMMAIVRQRLCSGLV